MDAPHKILIVEDESILAMLLQRSLEKHGYQVTGIVPFAESVIVSVSSKAPDAILMDITLKGGMDGIEAARLVKEKFEIPVIFLTAHTDDATMERASKVNYHAYIKKPVNISELMKTLAGLFGTVICR